MRLLHTSDWHLGRQFHGLSLLDEQALAMDRLVELAAEAAVDLVVIAGDLYDRAIPPAEAVRLFTDTLARLRATGAVVVAIAGNHDSHVRVSVYDELLAAQGVTIRGRWQRACEPVLVTPRDGGEPVAVYPLPYLEPLLDGPALQHLATEQAGAEAGPRSGRVDHQRAMELALAPIRADLVRRTARRSVLVAHAFVAGGRTSESERDLSVGNAEAVAVPTFTGFDYVALGHLHGAQQLDGARLAYSGTPLAYSFSEQDQVKSVRVVELDPRGVPAVEVVPLGVGRPLRTLEGPLEQLLTDPRLEDSRGAWVRALLSDEQLPRQAMARLRQRFPHALELRHQPPEQGRASASERSRQILQAADPLQRTLAFFSDQQGRTADGEEERLLRQALAQAAARRP